MEEMSGTKSVSVVLAGCGCPLRSMGWYHAMQILDGRVPNARLDHVVEPWYFSDAAKDGPGYEEFHSWRQEQEQKGIVFYSSLSQVPKASEKELRLAIISARTADNPKLLEECLKVGCQGIFLEKPGAPTVVELQSMKEKAIKAGAQVFMGFNKNVSSYLTKSREFASHYNGKCDVTFLHNNNYENSESALAECFERNAEGMLKNMAIHELAILATYYGVTIDTIAKVEADSKASSCKTLTGPSSGQLFTDFDKIKFKIVTKSGVEVNVAADRCGGDDSVGIVSDAETGGELARFTMPDKEIVLGIPALKAKYGDAMPYFFVQDPDYLKLKQLVVQHLLTGAPATGVATIDIAIETLKIAEYLTPLLQEQLK